MKPAHDVRACRAWDSPRRGRPSSPRRCTRGDRRRRHRRPLEGREHLRDLLPEGRFGTVRPDPASMRRRRRGRPGAPPGKPSSRPAAPRSARAEMYWPSFTQRLPRAASRLTTNGAARVWRRSQYRAGRQQHLPAAAHACCTSFADQVVDDGRAGGAVGRHGAHPARPGPQHAAVHRRDNQRRERRRDHVRVIEGKSGGGHVHQRGAPTAANRRGIAPAPTRRPRASAAKRRPGRNNTARGAATPLRR